MKPIRILIADDHTLMRDGLRSLLTGRADVEVVGEASDGRQAVQLAQELCPDIVLMDVAMPLLNGLEATRQIKTYCPQVYVLILSMHDNEEYVREVLAAGASGYLLKQAATDELVSAIQAVARGEAYLSPSITRYVLDVFIQHKDEAPASASLTPREREVLQLIAEGHTSRAIADMLCLSLKTVQAHRTNLMQKLDLHDRGALIKYAIQRKIIQI
jgi:DNA-binding NarL/FixJ family response regulator